MIVSEQKLSEPNLFNVVVAGFIHGVKCVCAEEALRLCNWQCEVVAAGCVENDAPVRRLRLVSIVKNGCGKVRGGNPVAQISGGPDAIAVTCFAQQAEGELTGIWRLNRCLIRSVIRRCNI